MEVFMNFRKIEEWLSNRKLNELVQLLKDEGIRLKTEESSAT